MRYRNGAHGYGLVTKALHWLTVAAILGQFLVGYSMDFGDAFGGQEDAAKAESDQREEAAEGQGEAAEERAEAESERREDAVDARDDDAAASVFSDVVTGRAFGDGLSLPEAHVLLGLSILALAVVRILWRKTTPLPPWAEHLGPGERRFEGLLEKVLLGSLVVVPVTGLLLVATGDDWLALHVAAQIVFLAAIAGHVGLVLRHTVLRPNRHLSRMV